MVIDKYTRPAVHGFWSSTKERHYLVLQNINTYKVRRINQITIYYSLDIDDLVKIYQKGFAPNFDHFLEIEWFQKIIDND